jgi:putative DNA primase/helicase
MLLPDTGQQSFLVLEGEGANGKSVYMAGLEAMLGEDNCSHVPLELFGDRFSRTQTLGKLANTPRLNDCSSEET